MIGLIEITTLAAVILAALVWCGVVQLSRHQRFGAWTPRRRAFVARAWLYAPLWIPGLLVLAALAPGLLSTLGGGVDHCATHVGHHHHLCFLHPPHASNATLAWALPLGLLGPPLALLAVCVRRVRRERRIIETLLRVSLPSPFGDDVRLLDRPEPVALTVGWWRPIVLLSAGLLDGVSSATRAAVLAHERAHVSRRDTRFAVIDRLTAALYPARVARRLIDHITLACEQACDDAAAIQVGGRVRMAQALTEVARLRLAPPLVGLSVASSVIEARVLQLLNPPPAGHRWLWAPALLVVALVGVGAGPIHEGIEHLITFLVH